MGKHLTTTIIKLYLHCLDFRCGELKLGGYLVLVMGVLILSAQNISGVRVSITITMELYMHCLELGSGEYEVGGFLILDMGKSLFLRY